MTFKDQAFRDIDGVFLNTDEFAFDVEFYIGGQTKKIKCVPDDDRLVDKTDMASVGIALGERLIFVKKSDLPVKPMPDARVKYDGGTWFVRNVTDNFGMLEIRLGKEKT